MRARYGIEGVLVAFILAACTGSESSPSTSAGGGAAGSAGTSGGSAGTGGGSAGTDGGSAGTDGGSAGTGGTSGGAAGTAGSGPALYQPPTAIIGGACGEAVLPSMPCSSGAVQEYCSLTNPEQVIMATCSASGRTQCEVIDECEPGWHACTATDYVARGGRDVAPSFSITNSAWLAACARDATGAALENEACSPCGADVDYPPSVQWWCDGEVVYEGGMAGDTLGVHTAPECMRVGANDAGHAAFWSMGFSGGAPSFVMCCLDGV